MLRGGRLTTATPGVLVLRAGRQRGQRVAAGPRLTMERAQTRESRQNMAAAAEFVVDDVQVALVHERRRDHVKTMCTPMRRSKR